jgi:RNA polymerase sigma factor (sigma-70 family)
MIFDASLKTECPDVTRIASANKVIKDRGEEYDLIRASQLALRPAYTDSYKKKETKKPKFSAKKVRVFEKATWCNKADKILKKYNLDKHPKIKAELERRHRIADAAITELIKHNYRLIISIARKFQGKGLSWSDLIQFGSDGFVYAVAKFDMTTGNKLSTFATQWVRQRISRAIENYSRTIRVPIHVQAIINEVKHVYKECLEEGDGPPTSTEIAKIYNENRRKKKNLKPITKEDVEAAGRHMQNITSLNEAAGDDENLTILDYIRDACPGPEGDVEVDMDKQELNRLIVQLPKEDQVFIKFKYGLVDGSPKSDAKAAQAFSIPIKQVRELETNILAQLNSFASQDRTNLAKEVEIFSVLILSGGGQHTKESLSVLMGVPIPAIPCKIYESTDKDQMVVMKKKLECLGARAEVISSF